MTVLINSLVNAPHGKYEINKTIKIVDFLKFTAGVCIL